MASGLPDYLYHRDWDRMTYSNHPPASTATEAHYQHQLNQELLMRHKEMMLRHQLQQRDQYMYRHQMVYHGMPGNTQNVWGITSADYGVACAPSPCRSCKGHHIDHSVDAKGRCSVSRAEFYSKVRKLFWHRYQILGHHPFKV